MSLQMAGEAGWPGGYRTVGFVQMALAAMLALTLRLWGDRPGSSDDPSGQESPAISRRSLLAHPGVPQAMAGFLCYCALEASCGLWASTFLVLGHGVAAETAALLASLFYVGITVGRFLSGVLTLRLDGEQLLTLGEGIIACAVVVLPIAPSEAFLGIGLALLGLGCAPIYPQMIQLTPHRFGEDGARSLMGLQMASAYVGSLAFPPLMGIILQSVSPLFLPVVAALLLAIMTACLRSCDHRVALSKEGAEGHLNR